MDRLQTLYLRYIIACVTTSPGISYTTLYMYVRAHDQSLKWDTKSVSLRDLDMIQDHRSGRLEWTIVHYYCSKFPICQHFQTRPPVESRADRETLSLGDAESLYIMFCACFRFFHGNPSYSKQLCAAPAPLIPVATKHTGRHGSGSILSRFGLLGERLDEVKENCPKLSKTEYFKDHTMQFICKVLFLFITVISIIVCPPVSTSPPGNIVSFFSFIPLSF